MKHFNLYLDESGKSSLIERNEEPFVLTGVILDNNEVKTVEGFFSYIKLKHGFNSQLPFHSYHVFEDPKTRISTRKAKDLVKTMTEFISLIPIKVKIISIDKTSFKKVLGVKSNNDFKGSEERKGMKEYPYRVMSSYHFSWFASFLNKEKAIGEIIADTRRGGDYQLLRSLNYCKDPDTSLTKEQSKLIKERCTAICFAEKYFLSGGLEITDLISYTSFFHARRIMNSMNEIRLAKLWEEIKKKMDEGDIYLLKEDDVRSFFKIKKGEVHKHLKKSLRSL